MLYHNAALPASIPWYGNCCAKIGICHGMFFRGATYKTICIYPTLKVWMIMEEQLLKSSILDQFINSHEQSYEEFLNTFTYLLKEKDGKTIQESKVDSLRKKSSTSELPNRNKQDGSPERSKEMWVSFPPRMPNENEVDKYLHLEDVDTDEETCSGSLVLPGEVEETVSCCTPFFDKPIQPKFRAWSVPQPLDSKAQELLGDDVQPFSLDAEFDYDNVALTPKFSEAELKAITELSEEKNGTDVESAPAED
ncbi:intraflagellar transport-associated protein isoform 4-T4 [Geothlypis trichas]